MKIKVSMINWLEVLKSTPKGGEGGEGGALLAPYMEYPDTKQELSYVMQWHIRGRSVHTDWRMEIDDHLVGWTVLTPGGISKPASTMEEGKEAIRSNGFEFKSENKNQGFRGETKARQPKVWLTVEGILKPGEVGATKEHPGVIIIIDTGKVYFGTQKPYFHEYFIKSNRRDGPFSSGDWTRIVVRAVNVSVIDPETKKPKEGTEMMWRVLIPGDQVPYAIDRGFKKKWKPPKGYIPVPPDWRKGEKYEAWETWVKDAWAGRGNAAPAGKEKEEKARSLEQLPFAGYKDFADCVRKNQDKGNPEAYCGAIKHQVEGTSSKFVVHYLSYMGQVVVRGIPNQKWFLRIEEGDKVHSWKAETDFTRFSPVPLTYEGIVDKKWISFEGDIPPNSKYNPSKSLTGKMTIIDKGSCSVDTEIVEGAEVLLVTFHGKDLAGKRRIAQEEKGSSIYTIEGLSEDLEGATFVLQLHEIETSVGLKKHWDVRISKSFEFNIWGNPLDIKGEGIGYKSMYKICKNPEPWMKIDKPKTEMKVGDLKTYVTPIDKGKVVLIDQNPPRFYSMEFEGEKLKGYFVYLEREGVGFFERAKVPHPLSAGDPSKGDYFAPFKEIRKAGWDYFWLEIYDQREFSRCVDNPEKYVPALKDVPAEVQEVLICLYPRPGTIHGARVSRIKFSDKWTITQASDWIKSNELHTWAGELIREEHKSVEDEALARIIDEELRRREKTPEERKIELELKKKKLELIEKWLEAQKE